MEDLNLYQNLFNENYTDVRKNDLIQKVFENKTKAIISEKSETFKMAKGGQVDDKVYSPYEFLHELLPKVYGRPYVVSDEVGKEYILRIEKEELELAEYVNSKLEEYGVNSIYKIDNKTLIEEIEIKRRKLISDKTFITETELLAYLFCHPELNKEHYIKELPNFDATSLLSAGVIMVDWDTKNSNYSYVYVYEYLSGNLYKKLTRLRQYKEELTNLGVLTEQQFLLQENALIKNMPAKAKITKDSDTCLFILPKSKFGEEFQIAPDDVMDIQMSYSRSFYATFKQWTETELDLSKITKSRTLKEVHLYFTDQQPMGANEDERVYSDRRKKAYIDGKVILLEFLNKGLTTNCQTRLEYTWNETFNFYTEPKYFKFPVACQLSNKFKNGKEFIPNETQIQSIQFSKTVGSGLLAYGVGVGKTASAIMNISYSIDNALCKKPLLVVPNPTYEKWKMEMFGGEVSIFKVDYIENDANLSLTFEKQEKAEKFAKAVNGTISVKREVINGHIPHLNKVVELYNLNEERVKSIKNYTENELLQIKNIADLVAFLKTVANDYQFDDVQINQKITSLYDDFEIENLFRNYNRERQQEFLNWWDKRKNRQAFNDNEAEARIYFNDNVYKTTVKQYFEKGIKIYREELPYILGTLKAFDDGTIFIATYEALEHLGLVLNNNYELEDDGSIYGELFYEISQGDLVSNANYRVKKNLPVLWRDAIYGKIKTKLDVSDFQFDYVVFDESHLLKKVIMDCKGIPSGGVREGSGTALRYPRKYSFGANEFPSSTALIGYFITRYVQINNNDKNVLHLTATPFTNKPAEIYSMLSLVNRKMVNESGFQYMEQFFDVYMDIAFELIFGNTGVTRKESLLGYKNLPQLRNLIYSLMDYKSGEDANIKRPTKLLFPSAEKGIQTTLPETPTQDVLFKQIKDYQRGRIEYNELCADAVEELDVDEMTEDDLIAYLNEKGTDVQKTKFEELEKPLNEDEFDELKTIVKKLSESSLQLNENDVTDEAEKDTFRVVKGLSLLKAVTLSPYLSTCQKEAGVEPTASQYIDSSPKLTYTLKCVKSIHDYEIQNDLPKSGIVIYMNIGVNVSFKTKTGQTFKWKESGFEKIKQYLINNMGYSAEEVSIVSGGMKPIDKEREKNKFLSGKSTVLIGSSTISTGVDLQNNASALFLCSYDWNPTDNEQINGRIHRQGNRFEKIRIVYPMVMNSADPNIFQQLYEKTLRIKNIWDRNDKGNTLDLKDFDVNSLRKGILDEPEDLATYWKEEQVEEIDTLDVVLDRRLTDLRNASTDKQTLDIFTPQMKGIIVILDAYKKYKQRKEAEERYNEKLGDAQDEYDEKVAELKEKLENDDDFAVTYGVEIKKAKEKLEKAKEKVAGDVYDFKNDPDGRFVYLTYDDIGDGDELFKNVNKYITNSDSLFNRMSYDEKREIYSSWLKNNFPRFQAGKYDLSKSEDEDTYNYVDIDSLAPSLNANKWKGAYRGFEKIKENLKILGIEFEDIPEAINLINEQKKEIADQKAQIFQEYPKKLQEYTLAKEERLVIQPTIEQRVEEFAEYNYILNEVVPTFDIDRAKVVEVPFEKLDIKPKAELIEKQIEQAVIEEEKPIVAEVDTTNLIDNLQNGLLIRFDLGSEKRGQKLVVDVFYEDGDYIQYSVIENKKGEILSESETEISEDEVIQYYTENYSKIIEQFYDDEEEEIEEQEEIIEEPSKKTEISKSEIYNQLIEGYELALEIEMDEAKIKLYQDLIEGYQLALELEN
jgi:hypothetical protein